MAGRSKGLRVLVVTRLFPNAAQPFAAAFNRQQFRELARRVEVELLAVIPWFPGAALAGRWSAAGRLLDVPQDELLDGLPVRHPRVLYVPRLHAVAPALYAASLLGEVRRLRGRVDVVLGSWAFPDGVAAVALGRLLGVPVAVKLHGSDMNVIGELPSVRFWLRRLLPRADRVLAVSRALADSARAVGVAPERLALVPNGVDRALFAVRDRAEARAALAGAGAPLEAGKRLLLYVGRLEAEKGILELFEAFERIAAVRGDVTLALVGDGDAGRACREAAARLPGRIVATGVRPLAEVATWVSACDLLTLPSWSEGTPNVVLEALASGRRVVATDVGGIPDVITSDLLGDLCSPRDASALEAALLRALERPYDPAEVAAHGPGGWDESAERLLGELRAVAGAGARARLRVVASPAEAA